MDKITEKYFNMLRLCISIDKTNDWVIWLQTVPLETFLQSVKGKKITDVDEVYSLIMDKSQLDPKKMTADNQVKIKKYISYFIEISTIM